MKRPPVGFAINSPTVGFGMIGSPTVGFGIKRPATEVWQEQKDRSTKYSILYIIFTSFQTNGLI